jgi:hypothetical protein
VIEMSVIEMTLRDGLSTREMSPRERRAPNVGLFDRFRSARRGRSGAEADLNYLRDWSLQRTGVEAFVEPETPVTPLTVVLVAADGEWTRRPAGGAAGARRVGERLRIPVYDVQKVGYPQRMRDYDARRRVERRRALRAELEDN